MRHINREGLDKLKQWEGLKLRASADIGGTLDIGYGHTGSDVHEGMLIDESHAELLLLNDLARFEKRVETLVTVPLTDNQFAALVSFDFNTGSLDKSTLLKELNKGNYDCVPFELAKWNKATVGGKKVVVKGLANRRAVEAALWASGGHVASNTAPVEMPTKPVVTKESVTWGAGVLASLASLFDGTGPVQWALGAVIVIAFAIGGILFLTKALKKG